MEEKTLISTIDTSRIKNITLKFPELMSSNAEELIKKEYLEIQSIKSSLHDHRDKVRELEKLLNEKEEIFSRKKDLFDIEFETVTKEYITRKSDMVFNGDLVYDYSKRYN
jgi:ribosome recycling factor